MFLVEKFRVIEMLWSFDKCNLMLRMNIWGMYMEMLMLGMLGSFDRCNIRSECRNKGMLAVNALISAI